MAVDLRLVDDLDVSDAGDARQWHPAKDMEHTEVAVIDYLPGSWPDNAGVVCIAASAPTMAARSAAAR
jgi:hypothetical protein